MATQTKKVSTTINGAPRSMTVTVKVPDTMEEALNRFGEAGCLDAVCRTLVTDVGNRIRPQLEKSDFTLEDAQKIADGASIGGQGSKAMTKEDMINALAALKASGELTAEDLAALS